MKQAIGVGGHRVYMCVCAFVTKDGQILKHPFLARDKIPYLLFVLSVSCSQIIGTIDSEI